MTWFWCWHRNCLVCCVGGRNGRDFSVGARSWVDFSTIMNHNCLGFVWGSKMIWFRVWIDFFLFLDSGGMQNWLVFRVGIEVRVYLQHKRGTAYECLTNISSSNSSPSTSSIDLKLVMVRDVSETKYYCYQVVLRNSSRKQRAAVSAFLQHHHHRPPPPPPSQHHHQY